MGIFSVIVMMWVKCSVDVSGGRSIGNPPVDAAVMTTDKQTVFGEVEQKNERINRRSDDIIAATAWTQSVQVKRQNAYMLHEL